MTPRSRRHDSIAFQVDAFYSAGEVNRKHAFGRSAQLLGRPPTNRDDSLDRMGLRGLERIALLAGGESL